MFLEFNDLMMLLAKPFMLNNIRKNAQQKTKTLIRN